MWEKFYRLNKLLLLYLESGEEILCKEKRVADKSEIM